ncbi:hypothetical protein [Nocardia sp. GAS34]|uniref:hypothetical protein n=1 Tax=unclassified Nocardia TaxID=2637762 RepID=UPI003D24C9E2
MTATLFVAGLVISTVRAGGDVFPSPFGSAAAALTYFTAHPDAVRTGATLQFASTIPLVIYASAAAARLNALGLRAVGATVTLAGGVLAAAFLACSAIVTWVLTVPEVLTDPPLVRALHTLAFFLGGPGCVVPTGMLIAALAATGVLGRGARATGRLDRHADRGNRWGQPEPTVDAVSVTEPTPDGGMHLEDGVHLTVLGQQIVTGAVIAGLAQLS